MLTLSDEVIRALPDGITRAEIREIKTEIREEQKITDMEVILEEPDPGSSGRTAVFQRFFTSITGKIRRNTGNCMKNCQKEN